MDVEVGSDSEAPLFVQVSLSEWLVLLIVEVGNSPLLAGLTSLGAELDLLVLVIVRSSNLEDSTLSVGEEFTSHVHDLHPS